MRMRFSIIALILLATFTCRAQPLADRMPASTIFYMGWTGSDSLGPGYDDSHFKAVLDASSCHQLINEFLPAVAQKIAESDPQAAQVMPMIAAVVQPMWKYPTALYFGGLEMGQGQPMPKLALLIDAGIGRSAGAGDAIRRAHYLQSRKRRRGHQRRSDSGRADGDFGSSRHRLADAG